MKRGIFINLAITFTLLFLLLLPWLVILVAGRIAEANGCDLSALSGGPEICNTLNVLIFISGWGSIATVSILGGIYALYLLGVVIYFLVSLVRSRKAHQPISQVPMGMILSTLALLGVAVVTVGIARLVNWYQVDLISACQGLPEEIAQNNARNGPLALGVRLPYPQGRPEQFTILFVSPDGEQLGRAGNLPDSKDPAWAPDGQRLAFIAQSAETGRKGLYLADAQGQVSGPVVESDLEMRAPAWSPDGQVLLFQRGLEQSSRTNIEIFSVNMNGGEPRQLPGGSPALDGEARFSPDGKQILFVSQRDGNSDIYLMNADGSDTRRLTRHPSPDIHPDWSPDGRWIVFASSRGSPSGKNNYHLYTMAPDGTNQCQLTHGENLEWQPSWSPDGQWIAYVSLLESRAYRVRPDGADITTLPLPEEIDSLLSIDWAVEP
jgi:TolB protein